MEEAGTPQGRYYCPELDVLRFAAFLLVFLHHTLPRDKNISSELILGAFAPAAYAFASACGFGLSIFFTLSAFLICELLLREREAVGSIRIKRFYLRRILRIWPLYFLALALGLAVAVLQGREAVYAATFGWFAVFMGAWVCALQGSMSNPAVVLWSISVEEQFYLFAPWLLQYLNRKSLYSFCAAILLAANIRLYFLGRALAADHSIWFNSFVQFECFAGGILVCLVLRERIPRFVAWQRMTLIATSFLCFFIACYKFHLRFDLAGEQNPGSWFLISGYALAAVGSVLLLTGFLGVDSSRLPGWAIYLGRISFGLYVYHDFAIHFMRHFKIGAFLCSPISNDDVRSILDAGLTLGLSFGLTALMAALSYRYFETPFLKMKQRQTVIESQPIAGVTD
jgi:peptidoglycan/LPS O-acetylase OafA/YrhL